MLKSIFSSLQVSDVSEILQSCNLKITGDPIVLCWVWLLAAAVLMSTIIYDIYLSHAHQCPGSCLST